MPCSTAARQLLEYFATEQAEQQAEYQALLEIQYSQQAQHEAILAIRDMEQAHLAGLQMSQMQNSGMWQQNLATASNGNMVEDLAIANSRIDGWRLDLYTEEIIYNY